MDDTGGTDDEAAARRPLPGEGDDGALAAKAMACAGTALEVTACAGTVWKLRPWRPARRRD